MRGPDLATGLLGGAVFAALVFGVGFFAIPDALSVRQVAVPQVASGTDSVIAPVPEKPPVRHVPEPESVRGVYMTSWVAGTPSLRAKVVNLIAETEVNAIVIDIKDDTGRVSYAVADPILKETGAEEVRIPDLREFIERLHMQGVYVIGRIASFQDPYMARERPDLAVKRASDPSKVWRDRKGLTWIDPGAKEHWEYLVRLAKDAHAAGFDEIQFDYIRFPSDGNMADILYPKSEGRVKHEVIKDFFAYLGTELRNEGVPISADLFGMTTTNTDDLNIGQVIEDAFPHFDAISPMVYPSHYPKNFNGWPDPNAVPYEIVKHSMDAAAARLATYNATVASTTVELRPWLQDNDYPVPYTPGMVRAQIKATYDAGLDSWLLWDAANTYTRDALLAEEPETPVI